MKFRKVQQVISILTCFLLLLTVAINKEQKVLGFRIQEQKEIPQLAENKDAIERIADDGSIIISTRQIAKDLKGYGGNVPLDIYLKDGRITKILALPNSETPSFFRRIEGKGILSRWNGLSPEEALNMEVDAISGATFSSNAVIQSVKRAMMYAKSSTLVKTNSSPTQLFSIKFACTLIVVLLGAILPYFLSSSRYKIILLVLNVVVLGLWSGSFLSYSLFINYLANGVNLWTSFIPLLLLIVAFILPLFGKKSHYCTWLCPMGSAQELAGIVIPYKYAISENLVRYLTYFRKGLWGVLMLLMWSGVCFQWMDYELFSAFLFQQAAWPIITIAVIFIILSSVVQRPYCRFVCPTGTLLRLSQKIK